MLPKGEGMIVPDEITKSNRKTVSLTILKSGKIVVKAPLKMNEQEINKFILLKQNWIQNKLANVLTVREKFKDVIDYEKVLVFGNKFSILLADSNAIELADNYQIIFPKKIAEKIRLKYLKNWLKKLSKNILMKRLEELATKFKFKFHSMKISDSKNRWGSCSSKKVISLNYKVIMLPPQIADYILVHELCHLSQMNHSTKFWQLVNACYPAVNTAREALKQYSFLLDLYR